MTDARKSLRMFIGPVQSFIASGRRTRDFWAGSFLLSRLAGEAMASVIRAGGSITLPAVQDNGKAIEPTLKSIMDVDNRLKPDDGSYQFEFENSPLGPLVGTLVNHFRAEIPVSFGTDEMDVVVKRVRSRFRNLADEVFKNIIARVLDDLPPEFDETWRNQVRERWDQQVSGNLFEVLWVMGPSDESDEGWQSECRWIEGRKAMRTHAPLIDSVNGDRCPIHPELTELSGFARIDHRQRQDKFWQCLRERVAKVTYPTWQVSSEFPNTLELREDERLSGFALVKRLFPILEPESIARAIGWVPCHTHTLGKVGSEWTLKEAQRTLRNWPSTAFVAAIPWIVKVGMHAPKEAAAYANDQYKELGADAIWEAERPQRHRIKGIDELLKANDSHGDAWRFAVLDGTLHFPRGLNKHRFVRQRELQTNPDARQKAKKISDSLAERLNQFRCSLRKLSDQRSFSAGPASPFYAMLEMDGDSMGTVFSVSISRAIRGSKALLRFAEGVHGIVHRHDGVLIYAGADDVNAMLPVDTAIDCAIALNALWTETIQHYFVDSTDEQCPKPTLSGSIVFADYQNALDDVKQLTHHRLDSVAKHGMGRNALAIAVMKSGGVVSEWASCWQDAQGNSPAGALLEFAYETSNSKSIASRLAYVIRKRFSVIIDAREGTDITSVSQELFDDEQMVQLLAKEMSDSGLSGLGDSDEDKALAVVNLVRPWYRLTGSDESLRAPRHVGGLLIARFLSSECLWPYFEYWRNRETEQTQ